MTAARLLTYDEPCLAKGFVYFAQAGIDGPIKIGTARNLAGRLFQIQTSNAEELFLLASIPGDADLEAKFHAQFAADQIRGEWFRPTDRIMACVGELVELWAKVGAPESWLWSANDSAAWHLKRMHRACALAPLPAVRRAADLVGVERVFGELRFEEFIEGWT